MRINYYKNDIKNTIEVSKVNIFYGYSGSGKTKLAKTLEEGLLGKDKSFSINGSNIIKDENNVLLLDSKESIHEHLKLSSKSYLKKLYYKPMQDYLNENEQVLDNINKQFSEINKQLHKITNKFNKRSTINTINLEFKITSNESILNDCINVTISDDISSSQSREMLFNLITILNFEKNTHIIIDNFDSFLDESGIITLFKLLENFNGIAYLFTNKPTSIMYSINKYSIFSVRNENIYNLSNLTYILNDSIIQDENKTYIEYMLNEGYDNITNKNQIELSRMINNSICNIGRMLTSKEYIICNEINYDIISIIPNNEKEEVFLKKINNLINND